MATAKARIKNGKLIAKVEYPLVSGAELQLGSINKLKALIKVPFLFSAKFFGLYNPKEKRNKKE